MYNGKPSPIVVISGKKADEIFRTPKETLSRSEKMRIVEIAKKRIAKEEIK